MLEINLIYYYNRPQQYGEFLTMRLLAQRRMTQVDVKAVIDAATNLVNNAVVAAFNVR